MVYKIPELTEIKEIFHAFSTIDEGNFSFVFDTEEIVRERRRKFLTRILGDYKNCATLYLEHGINIVVAKKSDTLATSDWRKARKADGILTNDPKLKLHIMVADCLPIIYFDPVNKAIGLAHAGWKGAELLMAEKMVDRLIGEFGSNPKDIIVAIGPSIRSDSYRFKNVIQKEKDRIKVWGKYINDNDDGTTSIDLVAFNIDQLEKVGIAKENIIVSDVDTAKDKRFFSHFRDSRTKEGDKGRFMCIVGIN